MKFYNPMFGAEPSESRTDSRSSILRPGEHEYCNPVHINNRDLEVASNAILEKVSPLVKIDE